MMSWHGCNYNFSRQNFRKKVLMKRRLMDYWDLNICYYSNIECRNETGIVTEVEITYNFQAEKILHISITTECM